MASIDPTAERMDLPIGNGLVLTLTGTDGTYGLRMLREDRDGRRTFLTPNANLSEADLTSIGRLFAAFARNHRRDTPWFGEVADDETQEGAFLAQSVVSAFA